MPYNASRDSRCWFVGFPENLKFTGNTACQFGRRFSHFFLQNVRMENTMMTISVANPIIIEIDSYTVMLSPPALLENRETDHQLPLAALYHNTAGDGSRSEKYNQGLAGSVWLPLVVVAEIATAAFLFCGHLGGQCGSD